MTVITRIAPSPTGYLHVGTARTALFNYLFARHHGGRFHLRIEDTDRERSTEAATRSILRSLQWLGLPWDGDIVYQFSRAGRHAEVARQLLEMGAAYHCYMTPQDIEAERATARTEGKMWHYDRRWRDRPASDTPPGVKPVIRLKAPLSGAVTVQDRVQGEITVQASELDDMVLLRSDGTPTYMLAVVVDDHDMGITHVVRGADHLTNTFRQWLIYQAMGWTPPEFAHIPLIHGADGAKLSKRHGALGVEEYEKMGYLPEALRNYLLRLGWAHGDDEIISDAQAIEWFSLEGVGKSPARFDFAKLDSLNGHYLREAAEERLVELLVGSGRLAASGVEQKTCLIKGMSGLKSRAKNLNELAENAKFYATSGPPPLDAKATEALEKGGREVLKTLLPALEAVAEWSQATLEEAARTHAERSGVKLGQIAQPLRAALTGSTTSPPIFEVMEVLGKTETLERILHAVGNR